MTIKHLSLLALVLPLFLAADLSPSLVAQTAETGAVVTQLKKGMIDFCREMIAIADGIKKREDVKKAEPRLATAAQKFTAVVEGLLENVDDMPSEALAGIEEFAEDPEVQSWGDKAKGAIDRLKARNAKAADDLEKVTDEESVEMRRGVMELMEKVMSRLMNEEFGPEPTPETEEAE